MRAVVLSASLILGGCGGTWQRSTSPQPGPSTPSPSPSYLSPTEPWAPPTHVEDGRRIMPVTFPDGTIAELVYRPELRLEELNVYPDTFVVGRPGACGSAMNATRYDPHGEWIVGKAPLAEHMSPDGTRVALWRGAPDHRPHDYLLYGFGSWSVLVPCRAPVSHKALTTWADNLHGRESRDGLLVLEGTGPLVLHPWRDQNGPTLRMSTRDVVIDIRPLSEQCDPSSGWGGDTDPGDGVLQWCVEPDGGIYIYSNGFSRAGKALLRDLVDGLEVRAVHPVGLKRSS